MAARQVSCCLRAEGELNNIHQVWDTLNSRCYGLVIEPWVYNDHLKVAIVFKRVSKRRVQFGVTERAPDGDDAVRARAIEAPLEYPISGPKRLYGDRLRKEGRV
jgi:hypothetical protein